MAATQIAGKSVLRKLQLRVGGWSAERVTWGLVALVTAGVVMDVTILKISGGLAQSSYDAMVRLRVVAAAPDPRIVIVDIDEASLLRMSQQFGRWPWPRDTLAVVLDHVEKQQPAAIVWDVVFSDADRLSPGGDAAFNAAVQRSTKSHFSVVRLPPANDGSSQITRNFLPGLWLPAGPDEALTSGKSTVALIPPVLPAVAAGRLGYNNGYVDADGVLRRFRYAETLSDGSAIQSLPFSIKKAINADMGRMTDAPVVGVFRPADELVAWRRKADIYPSVSFADVFSQADGAAPLRPVPNFAGKVVVIGATAPSLHDVHPTPLSPTQAGVDSLATVIDNALHNRHVAEMPRWLQSLLAIGLCIGIALRVRVHSVASLAPALFWLPASLLLISYLSLNGLPVFIDLNLAAGIGLVFLAALRIWNTWRRDYWSALTFASGTGQAIWCWRSEAPWVDAALDRTIDALEKHAPDCRVITPDVSTTWPASAHWPELAVYLAIAGPRQQIEGARAALSREISAIKGLAQVYSAEPVTLNGSISRQTLCAAALCGWASLTASAPLSFAISSRLPLIQGVSP